MLVSKAFIKRLCCAALLCVCGATLSVTCGQQQPQQSSSPSQSPTPHNNAQTSTPPSDEVIRINTDLVQTDVMVFDKSGRFVDNLAREQFVLTVDGKPQPISFFDRITAGSINEEAQLAAARGATVNPRRVKEASSVRPLDRGRTVFFFVDDLHMAPDSVARTRKTLLEFVDKEMGQNDQVVIVATSGQVGFLAQLTDNKTVLRRAVARLNYRPYNVRDFQRPPMSEYQALAIDRNDQDALGYFIDATVRDNPGMRRDAAENLVRSRSQQILQQAAYVTTNTLATLENLLRASAQMPGRKLAFFFSDGFFLDTRTSDMTTRLRRATDTAARNGTVIYTIDSRGLSTGMPDISNEVGFDPTGRLSRVDAGELTASQEPLYTLAADTGGRALVNTNALDKALTKTLKETAVYYLLAWQPAQSEGRNEKMRRIKVSIKDRPDLTVLTRRGFYEAPLESATAKSKKSKNKKASDTKQTVADKTPDGELRQALNSFYPSSALPLYLALGYTDVPNTGPVLTASIQLGAPEDNATPDKVAPDADVVCAIFDEQGKVIASLKDHIKPNAQGESAQPTTWTRPAVFSHQFRLAPGLYQVRLAARDSKTSQTGSVAQWIEIPNIARAGFTLGSLFLGERTLTAKASTSNANPTTGETSSSTPAANSTTEHVEFSVDRRFSRASDLRFLTIIYNPTRSGDKPPDVALQLQIFRDDQPVITTPIAKVRLDNIPDLTRIPYAADISLRGLPAGRYALQITAIDRAAKKSATQQANFTIE